MKSAAYALSFFISISAPAADWAQWRGPNFNGSSPEKGLPTQWTKDNVTWQLALPGWSAGTPVILGDKIFVTSSDDQTKTLHAVGVERKTGKILWNNKTGDGVSRDDKSNIASPSPIGPLK